MVEIPASGVVYSRGSHYLLTQPSSMCQVYVQINSQFISNSCTGFTGYIFKPHHVEKHLFLSPYLTQFSVLVVSNQINLDNTLIGEPTSKQGEGLYSSTHTSQGSSGVRTGGQHTPNECYYAIEQW